MKKCVFAKSVVVRMCNISEIEIVLTNAKQHTVHTVEMEAKGEGWHLPANRQNYLIVMLADVD